MAEKDRFPDPDAAHLEELRLRPNENAWRYEIEKILDGVREIIIEHRGDAGGYVEDLIEQALDPAICRVVFQDALEEQVKRWKPFRGLGGFLELLRHFTPRAGFPRLMELFRSKRPFPGDPPMDEPRFHGRDLRLEALHAIERYIPAPPLAEGQVEPASVQGQNADSYSVYINILQEHRSYSRYRHYAERVLERLGARDAALNVLENNTEPITSPVGVRYLATTLAKGVRDRQDLMEALGSLYFRVLSGDPSLEKDLRMHMQDFGYEFKHDLEGPIVIPPEPLGPAAIRLKVPHNLYDNYFGIYLSESGSAEVFQEQFGA